MSATPRGRMKVAGAIFALVPVIVALAGLLDGPSRDQAQAALGRSLVTFAIARTLDGVISVAQGTQVAVEPGGVGVNFALGEALDPINDLVERFSAAMLVATSSLALQNILLRMSEWWATNLMLVVAAVFALVAVWRPAWLGGISARTVMRVLSLVVFLRFAVPVFVLGSNFVFHTFLAVEQQAANDALTATGREIEELTEEGAQPPAEEPSLTQRLEGLVDDSLQALDVRARMASLGDRVSGAVEHIIDLIVIFALQAIILPVFFLWLFAEGLRKIAARTAQL